jgi:hypothetical protein
MKKITLALIILTLIYTNISFTQTLQYGIYNNPPGTNYLQIKAKPNSNFIANPSNLIFTIRYPATIPDLNFQIIWNAPFNQDTSTYCGTFNENWADSSYKYYSFYYVKDSLFPNVNWAANSLNLIVTLRVTGGAGTTTFSLTNLMPSLDELDRAYFEVDRATNVTDTISPFIPGATSVSGVSVPVIENNNEIPIDYSLSQNYPNPFNPETKIKFNLLEWKGLGERTVILKVFDINGRELTTLVNEQLPAGTYEVTFDGSNFSSGIYFYQLSAGDFFDVKKMLLVK